MIKPSRLTLGTATLGMVYGVSNPDAVMPVHDAEAILKRAWDAGVTCFDTAPAYGDAESRIGCWARSEGAEPNVVTKLPPLTCAPDRDVATLIDNAVIASATALGCSSIYGYLTHSATDFFRPAVREALECLTAEGRISSFGPSVYTCDDVKRVLDTVSPPIIQLPVSALDRRMIVSGALDALHIAGVTVFARSVFLQGAMLVAPNMLPSTLSGLEAPVLDLAKIAHELGISVASLALRYVLELRAVSSTVVGVYSAQQLDELMEVQSAPSLHSETVKAIENLADAIPHELLDPRFWPR